MNGRGSPEAFEKRFEGNVNTLRRLGTDILHGDE